MTVHRRQRNPCQTGGEQIVAGTDAVILRNPLAARGQLIHHAIGRVIGDADKRRDALVLQAFSRHFPRLLTRFDEGAGAECVRRGAGIDAQLRIRMPFELCLGAHQALADADALPLAVDLHERDMAMAQREQVLGDELAHAEVVDHDGIQRGTLPIIVDDDDRDALRQTDSVRAVHRRRGEDDPGDADVAHRAHQAQLARGIAVRFHQDGIVAGLVGLLRDGLRNERVVAARDKGKKNRDDRAVIRADSDGTLVAKRGNSVPHTPDGVLREGNAGGFAQDHGRRGGRYAGCARDI